MPDRVKNDQKMERILRSLCKTMLRLSFAVSHSSTEVIRGESGRPVTLPANVPARIWQRVSGLSVSRSVCPFGRMSVWPVHNQCWLAANHPPSCREQVAAHTSAPGFHHSPCDVISPHLVTPRYTLARDEHLSPPSTTLSFP